MSVGHSNAEADRKLKRFLKLNAKTRFSVAAGGTKAGNQAEDAAGVDE